MPFRFLTIFLLGCSLLLPAYAQRDIQFERIGLEEGLSQSIVSAVMQDERGFLWIGTQDGLNRYDGYEFKVYRRIPFDTTSISDNIIFALLEDSSGDLWVGTNNGLNHFDRETEIFTSYFNVPGDSTTLSSNNILGMAEGPDGDLWVNSGVPPQTFIDRLNRLTGSVKRYRPDPEDPTGFGSSFAVRAIVDSSNTLWVATLGGGIYKYLPESDSFLNFRHEPGNPNSLPDNWVNTIAESPSEPGVLWIGTGNIQTPASSGGFARFDTHTKTFTLFEADPGNNNALGGHAVYSIYEDADRMVWLGTNNGLSCYDPVSGTFSSYDPRSQISGGAFIGLTQLVEDVNGDLWMAANPNRGVLRFVKETGEFDEYRSRRNDPRSLSNDAVSVLFKDNFGVIWVGTQLQGLNKTDPFAANFTTFLPQADNPYSLNAPVTRAIFEDSDGILWVGTTGGGLQRYDEESGRFYSYRNDPLDPNSLLSDAVFVIDEDPQGRLWVGTFNGISILKKATGRFTNYRSIPGEPNTIGGNFIRDFYFDDDGTVWIGTDDNGITHFDYRAGTTDVYAPDPSTPNALQVPAVRHIHEDEDGIFWLGTVGGGLTRFDPSTKEFRHFTHNPSDTSTITSNIVQCIEEDEQGHLWLGLHGGGLARFNKEAETFTMWLEQISNIPNNVVYGILFDDDKNIWISTNNGLAKFYREKGFFKRFDVEDGLQSREFNGQAYFKAKDGKMYFGGIRGFNAFYPNEVSSNPFIPDVALTDFKINGESVPIGENSPLKNHISETSEIILSHDQNDITFDAVVLHYSRPEKNLFAFKLENYDENWRKSSTLRTAQYTNLDPGEYVFRAAGSNHDGKWNMSGTEIRIAITPPWWRTAWAYIAYAIIFAAGFVVVERIQRQRLTAKERERAQIREAQLRAEAAEFQSRAAEAQAQALAAENQRKSHELEEARKLQLSMLPAEVPDVPFLDIAVYMKTATEVGGDYYDFVPGENGMLTVTLGDATGHGLRAGTMVSVIKALFYADKTNEITPFFRTANETLKKMDLWNLYMALNVLRIGEESITLSSAGMPPLYINRADSGTVEKIVFKTMPLGAFADYPYEERNVPFHKGDTLLLLSDGITELFNSHKELFSAERLENIFRENVDKSPQEIIDIIIEEGRKWQNGTPQNDDVTLMVIRHT